MLTINPYYSYVVYKPALNTCISGHTFTLYLLNKKKKTSTEKKQKNIFQENLSPQCTNLTDHILLVQYIFLAFNKGI